MALVIALIVSIFASSLDWLCLKSCLGFTDATAQILYLGIVVVILYGITYAGFWTYSLIYGKKISLDLKFSTKQGRPFWGRYFAMFFYNNSIDEWEECRVILKDVKSLSNGWLPDKRIDAMDPLNWGAKMGIGSEKRIIKSKSIDGAIVDILHTSPKKRGGIISFTQQNGENIKAPPGKYQFSLVIEGTHLGEEFRIPVEAQFEFNGGMEISNIKPLMRKSDKRIRKVFVEKDELTKEFRRK